MRKFLKYLWIGLRCIWRVIFEYFAWILPCSRHPERKSIAYRYHKARSLVIYLLRHMHIDMSGVDASGLSFDGPVVYVSNHQSALDPLILIALSPRPVSFIAKKEARKIPIAGRFIAAIDGLFLDRDDAFQAMRLFREAKKNMEREGISYGLYPEGTRNKEPYEGKCLPFHAGSLKLAYMAKCKIIAFAHFGSFHTFDERFGKGRLYQLSKAAEYAYEDFKDIKTPVLSEKIHFALESLLPKLAEDDKKYFAEKKNRRRPKKWWKELPITES